MLNVHLINSVRLKIPSVIGACQCRISRRGICVFFLLILTRDITSGVHALQWQKVFRICAAAVVVRGNALSRRWLGVKCECTLQLPHTHTQSLTIRTQNLHKQTIFFSLLCILHISAEHNTNIRAIIHHRDAYSIV